jgi:hypothetical protein
LVVDAKAVQQKKLQSMNILGVCRKDFAGKPGSGSSGLNSIPSSPNLILWKEKALARPELLLTKA